MRFILDKNNKFILPLYILIFIKLIVLLYIFSTGMVFGGGESDASFYHNVAIGLKEFPNAWTMILTFLNDVGLYDRLGVSIFLSFLAVFIIPFMICNFALVQNSIEKQREFLYLFFIIYQNKQILKRT